MQKWDGCCCEMLSPIAGRDAGGQNGVKMDSKWTQNGVKMDSRWTQDGARCQEGDAKVDRESSTVEFSAENCIHMNPRTRLLGIDAADAGGF